MRNLTGYFRLSLFMLALSAAAIALHMVWVGHMPADIAKIGATLGILFVTGLFVAVISAPRALSAADTLPRL